MNNVMALSKFKKLVATPGLFSNSRNLGRMNSQYLIRNFTVSNCTSCSGAGKFVSKIEAANINHLATAGLNHVTLACLNAGLFTGPIPGLSRDGAAATTPPACGSSLVTAESQVPEVHKKRKQSIKRSEAGKAIKVADSVDASVTVSLKPDLSLATAKPSKGRSRAAVSMRLEFDGGSRGNPGTGGFGAVLKKMKSGEVVSNQKHGAEC